MNDLRVAVDDPELACASARIPVAVLAYPSVIVVADHLARGAGLELGDAAELPSAKRGVREAMAILEERQFVEVICDEHMADIQTGLAPQVARVVRVGNDIALCGAIIH